MSLQVAHFGSAAVVATCLLLNDEQTLAHGHQTASRGHVFGFRKLRDVGACVFESD
jgi:hypothetical protein